MMRVKSHSMDCMHLESMYYCMSLQNTLTLIGLFGYADAHGYFSLNDIQFWGLMYNLTDMSIETMESYFFKMDCDYTGEMNFVEFQLLCCCIIAAKDRVTKEFMMRHLKTLTSIQDTGKHNYLPLRDFVKIGALMGWNLGTLDRLFMYWDRKLELERNRIRTDRAMTLIIFAIEHENATHARRRVTAVRQFKRRWLLGMEDIITDYFAFDALPAPPVLWERMTETKPPTMKAMKETKEARGCCEYCFFACCVFIILPWFLTFCLFWFLWKEVPWFRSGLIKTRDALLCRPCRPAVHNFLERHRPSEDKTKKVRIPPDSSIFYNRNRAGAKKVAKFRYLQKQRETQGLFARIDPWQNSWLRAQLHLERLEKQLLRNRLRDGAKHEMILDDTYGVTAVYWKRYVAKPKKELTYKKVNPDDYLRPPKVESQLPVNTDDILQSKYPAAFFKKYSPEEILVAEHEVREEEFRLSQGEGEKRKRRAVRETVMGVTRSKQRDLNIQRQLQKRRELENRKTEEDAEKRPVSKSASKSATTSALLTSMKARKKFSKKKRSKK